MTKNKRRWFVLIVAHITREGGNLTPRMRIFRYSDAPPPHVMMDYEYGTVEMDSTPSSAEDDQRLEGLKTKSLRMDYTTPIIPCGAANFDGDDDFDQVVPRTVRP